LIIIIIISLSTGLQVCFGMSKTTEDEILFSWVVGLKAKIRITPTSSWFQDVDGTTRTFDGGSAEYEINISDVGDGEEKSQSIIIRKKLPVCPLLGIPIPLGKEIIFKTGLALNEHIIIFKQPHNFELNNVYYCKIGSSNSGVFYAIIKITDGRKMPSIIYQSLSSSLNCDIADIIKDKFNELIISYYNVNELTISDYNFRMVENPIIPGKVYHFDILRKLIDDGILEIGYRHFDVDYLKFDNTIMLTPEAYTYKFPNGSNTKLSMYFSSIKSMLKFRKRVLDVVA
jgi:hypothetical protein